MEDTVVSAPVASIVLSYASEPLRVSRTAEKEGPPRIAIHFGGATIFLTQTDAAELAAEIRLTLNRSN